MRVCMARLQRGVSSELSRKGGFSALWCVFVPAAFVIPLVVTYLIARVSETMASIPGSTFISKADTANSVYWVMGLTVLIMMVAAVQGYGVEIKNRTIDRLWLLFPDRWSVLFSSWLVYGTIAALVCAIQVPIILTALPRLFPLVQSEVNLFSESGIRFWWSIPLYAALVCGAGIGMAASLRSSVGATACLLLWAIVLEPRVVKLPNGETLMLYMPFFNAEYFTGQTMSEFEPPWEMNGAIIYCAVVFGGIFLLGGISARLRRS